MPEFVAARKYVTSGGSHDRPRLRGANFAHMQKSLGGTHGQLRNMLDAAADGGPGAARGGGGGGSGGGGSMVTIGDATLAAAYKSLPSGPLYEVLAALSPR